MTKQINVLFSYLIHYGVATTTVPRCKRFKEIPVRTIKVIIWIDLDFSLVYPCSQIDTVYAPWIQELHENNQKKRKHGNWGVRQSIPFLLLIIIIILFFYKYHHWRNPMHDTVPKPTPNCFAVHLYQQVFTPASSERASEGYKSMICTSPSVYLCDVFSRSGSFSISALWFMLILAISPPSLPSEPV